MARLLHIDADDLLLDAFRLGKQVYEAGFRPRHAISVWRGGTPIGLGVDAYFRFQGLTIHHTSIATSSYVGVGERQSDVVVKGMEHVIRSVCPEDGLLIIDDVYESGNTIRKIVEVLRARARRNAPRDIRVAVLHRKRELHEYTELPIFSMHDVEADVWLDYPHELADLVDDADPTDETIRRKSPTLHEILRSPPQPAEDVRVEERYSYASTRQVVEDAVRLGVRIVRDGFRPDFLVALWPGGVLAGLSIHEVFKYFARKEGWDTPTPDHIPLNTTSTHLSYRSNIIGLDYLEERVEHHHKVLLVDTSFRSGRITSDVVNTLKSTLRRNLDLERVRIASVYYNPDDQRTWSARPFRRQPDYYLRKTDKLVIYPAAPYRFKNPRDELARYNPQLKEILFP